MGELLRLLSEASGLPSPRLRLPAPPLVPLAYANAALCALTGGCPRLTPDTARMVRHRMFYSPTKAIRELGLSQTPAREALARAVARFQENGYVKGHSLPAGSQ